jgi:hypothetical protein
MLSSLSSIERKRGIRRTADRIWGSGRHTGGKWDYLSYQPKACFRSGRPYLLDSLSRSTSPARHHENTTHWVAARKYAP